MKQLLGSGRVKSPDLDPIELLLAPAYLKNAVHAQKKPLQFCQAVGWSSSTAGKDSQQVTANAWRQLLLFRLAQTVVKIKGKINFSFSCDNKKNLCLKTTCCVYLCCLWLILEFARRCEALKRDKWGRGGEGKRFCTPDSTLNSDAELPDQTWTSLLQSRRCQKPEAEVASKRWPSRRAGSPHTSSTAQHSCSQHSQTDPRGIIPTRGALFTAKSGPRSDRPPGRL